MTSGFEESNFLVITIDDKQPGLTIHTNAEGSALEKIVQVIKRSSLNLEEGPKVQLDNVNNMPVLVVFKSDERKSPDNKVFPASGLVASVCTILTDLWKVGWKLGSHHGIFSRNMKRGSIFLSQDNEAGDDDRSRIEFGCTFDSGGPDRRRFLLLPKSLVVEETFSKMTDVEISMLKRRGHNFEVSDLTSHWCLRMFPDEEEEKDRHTKVTSCLSMLQMLERRGFHIHVTIPAFGKGLLDTIVFSTGHEKGQSRTSNFWAMTIETKIISGVSYFETLKPSRDDDDDDDDDEEDVLPPTWRLHTAGVRTVKAPPDVISALSNTIRDYPSNACKPSKLWSNNSEDGKILMMQMLRALLKLGWHVTCTLNSIFDHSVLIFTKGSLVPVVDRNVVESNVSTSMVLLSVRSGREMGINLLLQGKDMPRASSLKSDLTKKILEDLKTAKLKKVKEYDRLLFGFPASTFTFSGHSRGLEVLLCAATSMGKCGWSLHSMANLTGSCSSFSCSVGCGNVWSHSWVFVKTRSPVVPRLEQGGRPTEQHDILI